MGWTKKVWRGNVADFLLELGILNFQKKLWMNEVPDYQGGLDQVYLGLECSVVPEHLDDFLKDGYLNQDEKEKLKHIENLLDKLDDYSPLEYEKLWATEEWLKICSLAKDTLMNHFFNDLDEESRRLLENYSS